MRFIYLMLAMTIFEERFFSSVFFLFFVASIADSRDDDHDDIDIKMLCLCECVCVYCFTQIHLLEL